jgi:hypothetical protein
VVQSQVGLQSGAASVCEHSQKRLRIKDIRERRLDTVFGRVTVSCRRAEVLTEMLPGLNRRILPFDRPAVATLPFAMQLAAPSLTMLEIFVLMALTFWVAS